MFIFKNVFKFYLIIVIILFSSCNSNNENKIPDGIIPESKMITIITDLHLTDATLNIKHISKRSNNKEIAKYYKSVLKKYGYSRLQFNKSIEYYSDEPEKLDEIYDKVLEELSKKQEMVKKEK